MKGASVLDDDAGSEIALHLTFKILNEESRDIYLSRADHSNQNMFASHCKSESFCVITVWRYIGSNRTNSKVSWKSPFSLIF